MDDSLTDTRIQALSLVDLERAAWQAVIDAEATNKPSSRVKELVDAAYAASIAAMVAGIRLGKHTG